MILMSTCSPVLGNITIEEAWFYFRGSLPLEITPSSLELNSAIYKVVEPSLQYQGRIDDEIISSWRCL